MQDEQDNSAKNGNSSSFSRRKFLQGASASILAALASDRVISAARAGGEHESAFHNPVSHETLEKLKRQLNCTIINPQGNDYAKSVSLDNGRVKLRPAFFVRPNKIEDISTLVSFCRDNGHKLTVKGGGHSASGYCLSDGGIVLDLSAMNKIELLSHSGNSGVVRIQMGAIWYDVYKYLLDSNTNLIPVGGGCPTVGVPGFLLGGGYSFVSRSYGMSVDNLRALTIVTADSVVHTISADSVDPHERDLFWACRGGGGGNFGIIVEAEIEVHKPEPSQMFIGRIRYPASMCQKVIGFYNTYVESLPNEMAIYGEWKKKDALAKSGDQIFGFTAVYNGDASKGSQLLQPLLQKEFSPTYSNTESTSLPEFEFANGKFSLVEKLQAYIRSGVMPPGAMNADAIDILQRYMNTAPSDESFIVWTHAGGAIEKVAEDATAFPHRKARFIPEVKAIWKDPKDARKNIEWAYKFFEELGRDKRFIGAYVNYIDPLLPDWKTAYYGNNIERLQSVKSYWDPKNFFSFQQSIDSSFNPGGNFPLDLSPLDRTFAT